MKYNHTTTNKNNKTFKDKMYEVPKGRLLSKAQKAAIVGSLLIASLVGYEANDAVQSFTKEAAAANAAEAALPQNVVASSIDSLQKGGTVKFIKGEFAFGAKLGANNNEESFIVENPAVVESNGKFIPYFVPAEKEMNTGKQDLKSDSGENLVFTGMVAYSQPINISQSEFQALPEAHLNKSGNLVADVNGQNIHVGFNNQ